MWNKMRFIMPEDLHDFVFFSKNFTRASGALVPFLNKSQVYYPSPFTEAPYRVLSH
ncbi:protein of unknown function [Xenorhabdus poinarii G6]|uniref:Uncharacterized protein n=1 Tax=Xenorhabdus poinarii G6 TaxID=1354304 RepID=A0A068R5F9_9GAMM|nr:protein of unknown function [Xenorhabdus poinarii G6]